MEVESVENEYIWSRKCPGSNTKKQKLKILVDISWP